MHLAVDLQLLIYCGYMWQECRPEFSFMLTSVMKISFRDIGRMGLHWVAKEVNQQLQD